MFLTSCSDRLEITTIISECIWTKQFTYDKADILAMSPEFRRQLLDYQTKQKKHCDDTED